MSSQAHSQSPPQTKSQKPDLSGLRPPKSAFTRFFWRWKMWVSGTFVLSMLEPWETFVLVSFCLIFVLLLVGGVYRYLPAQAVFLARRAHYYVVGTDANGAGVGTWWRAKEL